MASKLKLAIDVIRSIKNWPTYFADYLGLVKGKTVLYELKNGIRYRLRPNTFDRNVINEVWLYGFYTPEGFRIGKNDVVLEIGGHIGVFSVYASKLAKKVYVFEPVPDNYRLLEENLRLNNAGNVLLVKKAVSGKSGSMKMNINEHHTHSLTIKDGDGNTIEVETITLKEFLKENKIPRVDFLKMDCEGSEYEILLDCPSEVLDRIRKISIEYHVSGGNLDHNSLKEFLEKGGFKVTVKPVLKGNGMLYASRKT